MNNNIEITRKCKARIIEFKSKGSIDYLIDTLIDMKKQGCNDCMIIQNNLMPNSVEIRISGQVGRINKTLVMVCDLSPKSPMPFSCDFGGLGSNQDCGFKLSNKDSALKTICGLIEKVSLRDAEIEGLRSFKDRYIVLQDKNCELLNKMDTIEERRASFIEKLMHENEKLRKRNYDLENEKLKSENKKQSGFIEDIESERNIDIMTKGVLVNLTNENEELKAHNSDKSNKIQELKELLDRSLKEKCDIWKWSDAQRDIIDGMKAKNTAHAALVEILKEYIEAGNHVSDEVNRAVEDIEIIVPILYGNARKQSYVFRQLQNQVFERMKLHYLHVNNEELGGVSADLDYLGKEDMFELVILGGAVNKYRIASELVECSQDEFEQALGNIKKNK